MTTATPPHVRLPFPTLAQDWDSYSAEDHAVWRELYARRMSTLATTASTRVLEGIERIGLSPAQVPRLSDVNALLLPVTGWSAVAVGGFIPARDFFRSLAQRRFPTTTVVRPPEEIDYTEAPDIFHDVFGHVPLHADPVFAGLLQRFGALSLHVRGDEQTTALARFFWFTIEFGLVREQGTVKIFGSGLVSSTADAANALGEGCDRRPFSVQDVLEQDFRIDRMQNVLFVLESFEALADALEEATDLLHLRSEHEAPRSARNRELMVDSLLARSNLSTQRPRRR